MRELHEATPARLPTTFKQLVPEQLAQGAPVPTVYARPEATTMQVVPQVLAVMAA